MTDINIIDQAKEFAKSVHKKDKRADGRDYFEHLDLVYRIINYWGAIDIIKAAAYLHDTVEDSNVTIEILEGLFGYEVARIVGALTNKHSNYLDYILELKNNQYLFPNNLAIGIKKADMIANYYDTIYFPSKNTHQMKHLKNKGELSFYILFGKKIWQQSEIALIKNGVI